MKILKIIILSMVTASSFAQVGYFVEVGYKRGRTSFNTAYALVEPGVVDQKTYYKDAFTQSNFQIYFGEETDSRYYRINFDGLFYGPLMLINSHKTSKFYKSDFKKYKKRIPHSNPTFNSTDSSFSLNPGSANFNIPQNGATDYKTIDFDYALVGDGFKVGINYAYGFLGTGTFTYGLFSRYSYSPVIKSVAIAYTQLGLKFYIDSPNDIPIEASVGVNALFARKFKANTERRNGFGIDLEAKYYFIKDNTFRPYISGYLEFKTFEEFMVTQSNNIPKFYSNAFGLTIGVSIVEDY